MLYESSYADFQFIVRSEAVFFHPATGVETHRIPALVANFGTHGSEFSAQNPLTGEIERHSDIRGFFFDSEVAKEEKGWTDEEHDSVVHSLDRLCMQQPFLVARVEHQVMPPTKPWPTYDETHWKTIPVLATQLGLVEQTLAYERENKNRESVIIPLTEAVTQREEQPLEPAVIGLE